MFTRLQLLVTYGESCITLTIVKLVSAVETSYGRMLSDMIKCCVLVLLVEVVVKMRFQNCHCDSPMTAEPSVMLVVNAISEWRNKGNTSTSNMSIG